MPGLKTFREYLRKWKAESTIHGVFYIRCGGGCFTRTVSVVGSLVMLGCFSLALYLSRLTVADYLTLRVETEVSFPQISRGQIAIGFPAITFCPNNLMMYGVVQGNPLYTLPVFVQIYQSMDYANTSSAGFERALKMCPMGSKPVLPVLKVEGSLSQTLYDFGQPVVTKVGVPNSQNSVIGCRWKRKALTCTDLFLNINTDTGPCFTFNPSESLVDSYFLLNESLASYAVNNPEWFKNCTAEVGKTNGTCTGYNHCPESLVPCLSYFEQPMVLDDKVAIMPLTTAFGTTAAQIGKYNLTLDTPGPSSGFELLLSVQPGEYCATQVQNTFGFSATLHDHNITPLIFNSPAIELLPGFVIDVAIRVMQMQRETDHYPTTNPNFCTSTQTLKYYPLLKTYNQQACYTQCLSIIINQTCSCLPFCAPLKLVQEITFDKEGNAGVCGGVRNPNALPCYLDVMAGRNYDRYHYQNVSLSQYKTYWGLTAACDCPQQCFEETYYTEVSYSTLQSAATFRTMTTDNVTLQLLANMSLSEFRKSYLLARFYLKQPQFQLVNEKQAVQIGDVVNGIGGALGLCFGMSFISLAELPFFSLAGLLASLFVRKQHLAENPPNVE